LNKTSLKNRDLWQDGDSSLSYDELEKLVLRGTDIAGLFVNEITSKVKQYNLYVSKERQLTTKKDVKPLDFSWNIPEEYINLDIAKYVIGKLVQEAKLKSLTREQIFERMARSADELILYEKYNAMDILRALIYIINTLDAHKIVWGIGRGSCVASYILYLIGVHDVDSIKYELDIVDFLHD
jgi:DNA polymerase III alpha subunit